MVSCRWQLAHRISYCKEGKGDHAFAPLRPYVVEFEDHYIRFSAADARCVPKVIEEVTEVPSLNWTVGGHA